MVKEATKKAQEYSRKYYLEHRKERLSYQRHYGDAKSGGIVERTIRGAQTQYTDGVDVWLRSMARLCAMPRGGFDWTGRNFDDEF